MKNILLSTGFKSQPTAKHQGFTLLELIITVAIVAILSAAAIPSFSELIMKSRLTSQARGLMASALLARSEAIKRNQAVTLCASSNGSTCNGTWANGWIVLSADNLVLHSHQAAPTGFLINSALTSITFSASGLGASMATLTICRSTPAAGKEERVLSISGTGRPSISKTYAGVCAA
ncbi:MAG: GspH/FimT family pseudopilin [Pseudomonadota bacterium]